MPRGLDFDNLWNDFLELERGPNGIPRVILAAELGISQPSLYRALRLWEQAGRIEIGKASGKRPAHITFLSTTKVEVAPRNGAPPRKKRRRRRSNGSESLGFDDGGFMEYRVSRLYDENKKLHKRLDDLEELILTLGKRSAFSKRGTFR